MRDIVLALLSFTFIVHVPAVLKVTVLEVLSLSRVKLVYVQEGLNVTIASHTPDVYVKAIESQRLRLALVVEKFPALVTLTLYVCGVTVHPVVPPVVVPHVVVPPVVQVDVVQPVVVPPVVVPQVVVPPVVVHPVVVPPVVVNVRALSVAAN